MKIRTKLYLGTLISICLIVVLIGILIHSTVSISNQNEHSSISWQTLQAVSELDILTHEYLMHHEVRPQEQWHRRYITLEQSLKALERYSNDEKEIKLTKQLSENYRIIG